MYKTESKKEMKCERRRKIIKRLFTEMPPIDHIKLSQKSNTERTFAHLFAPNIRDDNDDIRIETEMKPCQDEIGLLKTQD